MTRKGLQEFLSRRRKWIECLNKKDPNSVVRQLYRMNWNATVYAIMNRARSLSPPDPDGGFKQSPLLGEYLDSVFQLEQAMAIRRLTDVGRGRRSNITAAGEFDVYSLSAIIADMKLNQRLFTRGVLLEVDAVETGIATPKMINVWNRNQLNQDIDRMARVSYSRRSDDDMVRITVFDRLLDRLKSVSKKFTDYTNKFVAHAASEESRKKNDEDSIRFAIVDVWRAHEALCRVANFVSVHFLTGTVYSFMPYGAGDQFKYMDRPLAVRNKLHLLRDYWHDRESTVNSWSGIELAELLPK